MARPVIHWEGPGRPTRAELAAIQRAYRAGHIRSGDHVGRARGRRRPARRNPEPTPAEDAYRQFHWGKRPKRRKAYLLPTPSEVFELGRLRAVEYETRKGSQYAIWVHHFGWPRPVLTGTADGRLGPILGGNARVTARGIVG